MSIKNNSNETFFTIIIPTRERSDTLMHTLKTALSQDYDQFNVLVSDNASHDATRKKVSSISDPRLKYVNTGKRVSMSENWEFALSHVDKGWITVLGDDDALLPGTLRKVNGIIKNTNTTAIRSNGCSYKWPGFNGSSYGELRISNKKGYEIRESSQMLQRVLDGEMNYNELPMLYNGGFVFFELIRQAKLVTKRFFMSMIPDVYSAIVLSLLTDTYVYSYEPLAINGASLHSSGTANSERVKQKRRYDPVDRFFSEENIPFHEDLPLLENGRPPRSIEVAVYEAYLQADKFHALKPVVTCRTQQLKLVIKNSEANHSELVEWANRFASKHKIELPQMNLSDRAAVKLNRLVRLIKKAGGTYKLTGVSGCPLQNVCDASIVAGALKNVHPSLMSRIISNGRTGPKNAY